MFRTIFVTTAVLGAASLALFTFRPTWAVHAGLDVWNLPELERNLAAHEDLRQQLEHKDDIIVERIAAKENVIRELIKEHLTLPEAAARFRKLNTESESCPGSPPDCFPGQTESERYCRQVLRWVEIETQTWQPAEAEEVRCRLEAELDLLLVSCNGKVSLPSI